jgi:intraflagellar transport protein 46
MPPKRFEDEDISEGSTDDDDSTESEGSDESSASTTSDTASEEEFKPAQSGNVVKNAPHDEEFRVSGPAGAAPVSGGTQPGQRAPAAAPAGNNPTLSSSAVHNQPHDEEFVVSGAASGSVKGPAKGPAPAAQPGKKGAPAPVGGQRGGQLHNEHADEFVEVEDDMDEDDDVPTPQKQPVAGASTSQKMSAAGSVEKLKDTNHDEVYHVQPSSSSVKSTSGPAPGGRGPQPAPLPARVAPAPAPNATSMAAPEDTESEDDTDEESDEGETPTMANVRPTGATGPTVTQLSSVEYNAQDYVAIVNNAPPDVRDLFAYITAYTPMTIECPAKLKPFIPDYIPSVGDIDTFCKVPRPDDKPDNFGLAVVDEPASRMSNPAIVKAWLANLETVSGVTTDNILDTLDDAANNPKRIDRWITDLRDTQSAKPPPTVYYSKPMPNIENLMQEWPAQFEEVLNSDLQLPPPGIDLDIDQYVRMLCAILDIPVHSNLVESLHVMFTLYLEFRENQHFKAA